MIPFELRTPDVSIPLSLREHVARKLDFAVRSFGDRIDRVVVRITDLDGVDTVPEKRCRITARVFATEQVEVKAVDSDAFVAVSQAALRLREAVLARSVPSATERLVARIDERTYDGHSTDDNGG